MDGRRITFDEGLSPRVRGNPGASFRNAMRPRSIPARAGEPRLPVPALPQPGLSPRVRRNLVQPLFDHLGEGSIPARAGEPRPSCGSADPGRVYPRACGGTAESRLSKVKAAGLSPRVRGNPPRLPVVA